MRVKVMAQAPEARQPTGLTHQAGECECYQSLRNSLMGQASQLPMTIRGAIIRDNVYDFVSEFDDMALSLGCIAGERFEGHARSLSLLRAFPLLTHE